jgi:hypothetical protein
MDTIVLCINANAGLNKWYCSHYGNRITPGTEKLSDRGRCIHCEKAEPPYEEAPSFMRNDDED